MGEVKQKSRRQLIAVLSAAIMFLMVLMPAANVSAAERLTNTGPIDGIDVDPDVGIHNSYAWCGAVFSQGDDDYLWVGTNRDLGGAILSAAEAQLGASDFDFDLIYDISGIPKQSADKAAKIYRYNLNDPEATWEFVYENPAFSGYRKMVVFNGDLYAFAGLTNRTPMPGYQYSAVYRFSSDFEPGVNEPEAVHWTRLPNLSLSNLAMECYRSAFVYDGKLYLGIYDGRIYSTDGTGLVGMTPTNNSVPGTVFHEGWDLVANLGEMYDFAEGGNIWDIIVFNDSLYAFVTGAGFTVFKLTETDGEWAAEQIVGELEDARYPSGLGISGHVAASPFLFNDHVYVTTFANGPVFLAQGAAGNLDYAFNELFVPATIYRFDAEDEWEVVVGDFVGENVAKDKNGTVVPSAGGDMRAGFYPGDNERNPSANQYVWYMAEYQGRLYASTWDVGVFRSMLPAMLALTFAQTYGMGNVAAIMPLITEVSDNFSAVIQSLTAGELAQAIGDISILMKAAAEELQALEIDGPDALSELRGILEKLSADIVDVIEEASFTVIAQISDLRDSLSRLFFAVSQTAPEISVALKDTLSALSTTAFFLFDSSNPAGFDLFYSDDGVNFYPYTVNGLGDPNNYGGRVILPTENYGLLIFTANPFTGCQIWRLDESDKITGDIPGTALIGLNEQISFDVISVGLMPNDASVTLSDGTSVSATIEMIEELDPSFKYYRSTVEVQRNLLGQNVYVETEDPVLLYLYRVTLTGTEEFEGVLTVTIEIDGNILEGNIDLEVKGLVTVDTECSKGIKDLICSLMKENDGTYTCTLIFELLKGFKDPIEMIITGDSVPAYDLVGPDADGRYIATISGIEDNIEVTVTAAAADPVDPLDAVNSDGASDPVNWVLIGAAAAAVAVVLVIIGFYFLRAKP